MIRILAAIKASPSRLRESRRQQIRYWAPSILAAASAGMALMIVGATPFSRASGLALAILGFTASMRRMGFIASFGGGLTLTFCPIFWSQAGGAASYLDTITAALVLAAVGAVLVAILLKTQYLGIGLGIVIFVSVFLTRSGSAQSLRLTGLATAWLIYLLVDLILITNPRPGTTAPRRPERYHTAGLILLLAVGALNDPLVILLAPATLLGLYLSNARLPSWYWIGAIVTAVVGAVLLVQTYASPQLELLNPLGWRDANRWIDLGRLLSNQVSVVGVALGIVGLARLSRWYPPLGTVLVIAFAAYTVFGLVYLGSYRDILLLPLVMILVMWITYAVNAFGQWVNKTLASDIAQWTHLVSLIYLVLPCHIALEYRTIVMVAVAVARISNPCIVEW